ncbi:hypothetical protein R4536_17265 [Vibrio cholerae]|nr:hypothetical protein [Vibrio cholerae]WOQ88697.1 hypothetical protein R4536_17265 [Vibrio cholerae]
MPSHRDYFDYSFFTQSTSHL